jgi:uncharacterized protein YndB with AHSA1/START domain
MSVEPIAPYLEPLRKSILVPRTPADAFDLFTAGMSRWWPLGTHSVSADRAAGCGIEPRVGGAVYEVRDDGERYEWGRVLAWEPPSRFVMSWYPGRNPDTSQEVELTFRPEGTGTRVELEHRGWASLGEDAKEMRKGYDQGWGEVFERRFAQACAAKANP